MPKHVKEIEKPDGAKNSCIYVYRAPIELKTLVVVSLLGTMVHKLHMCHNTGRWSSIVQATRFHPLILGNFQQPKC